jgi:uncharacterized membrane protein (DUF106 family)
LDSITAVTVWLGDLAFALLSVFSPGVALWIVSALTGVAMLMVWRYTSNQDAIGNVRNQIAANLLATRLFKDNLAVTFRAQRQIVWQAGRLLGLSIRPMLIMMVPVVLIMVQIGLRYEHVPIAAGEMARVQATLKPGAKVDGLADELRLPEGLTTASNDPCRVQPLRTIDWRITANDPGNHALVFGLAPDTVEMPLAVGEGFDRISSRRGGGFFDRLLYSAEPAIPESSVFESIRVYYPARSTPIFGLDIHWLISFLILSIVFGLIFKPILKVKI